MLIQGLYYPIERKASHKKKKHEDKKKFRTDALLNAL